MANEEHLSILEQGVTAWNEWYSKTKTLDRPDLKGADLSDRNLSGATFSFTDLNGVDARHANFTNAKLISAKLDDANLSAADLTDAVLSNASLRNINLSGANLGYAELYNANLSGANLSGADLRGTRFDDTVVGNTTFANSDLSETKGLRLIRHYRPSTVGIDTIYKSKGKIPESFLRECGVPDSFITQMHSLVGADEGIQFYSCFISYSSKDDEFARRLHGRMRDAHLRVWFAPEEMKGGNLLIEQIETAIRVYDKLLIVLSDASLQSEWVMTELRKARNAERQSGKRKLFPVRLVDFETLRNWECFDADSGKDLAVELREYFIPDFSNWKDHDSFEAGFDRLLKDLRAESPAP